MIPALNEEGALPGVLARMPAEVSRVVVADNGSTDATAQVAARGGAEVVREDEPGYGAACLAGIAHLLSHGEPPDVLVFLDADGSNDPGAIPELVAPIARGEADLVLGVRRSARGGTGTIQLHARLGNRFVLLLSRLLFGRAFRDLPPFRAIRVPAYVALAMDDRNWGWTLQMQLRAVIHGLRVVEVPLPHGDRTWGRSKITGSPLMSVRVGLKMFYTLARERWRGFSSRNSSSTE